MTIQTNTNYYEAMAKEAENYRQIREEEIEKFLKKSPVGIKKSAIEEVLEARGSNYGIFSEHARITQNIKNSMADSNNWNKLSPEMKESLEMIAHKLGRILNGNPSYKDSWTDVIGYATLVEKEL